MSMFWVLFDVCQNIESSLLRIIKRRQMNKEPHVQTGKLNTKNTYTRVPECLVHVLDMCNLVRLPYLPSQSCRSINNAFISFSVKSSIFYKNNTFLNGKKFWYIFIQSYPLKRSMLNEDQSSERIVSLFLVLRL